MKVTNLKPFLNELNMDCLKELLVHSVNGTATKGPTNVKPNGTPVKEQTAETTLQEHPEDAPQSRTSSDIIRGKIQRLGDFIDTDAALLECKTPTEFGTYCLKHTHPEFRSRASAGYNVAIERRSFGCGSSGEGAVSALVGCGIQCVIAKSFALSTLVTHRILVFWE
ncbi:hypothetical protein V8E51_019440 [Hyaloscypha variabilis]